MTWLFKCYIFVANFYPSIKKHITAIKNQIVMGYVKKCSTKAVGSTQPIKNRNPLVRRSQSKIKNCLRLALFLVFAAQQISGQAVNDPWVQRRIEVLIAQDQRILESINNSTEGEREQRLQQYIERRDSRYQRMADMGDPAAIAFLKSLGMERTKTTSSPTRGGFDFYVSTTGSDSNPGTQSAPFRTIQKALSSYYSDYNFIKVEDGVYTECINIDFNMIYDSWRCYIIVGNINQPDAVVINGAGNGTVISIEGNARLELEGIMITGAKKNGNQAVIELKIEDILNVQNSIICNNSSNRAIIDLYQYSGTQLFNTLICDNTVDGNSEDGIIVGNYVYMANSTIANNKAPATIITKNYVSAYIFNSIVYNPQANFEIIHKGLYFSTSYSNIRNYGSITGNNISIGAGMLDTDPKFVSPQHNMYQLADGSPCIDAGNPASQHNDAPFPPAKETLRNDMGAYGGPYVSQQPYQIAPISKIKFTYDLSGNRDSRTKEIIMSSRAGTSPSMLKSTAGGTDAAEVDATEFPKYEDILSGMKITIYPNPTQGILRVDITGGEISKDARIYLYNAQGMMIRQLTGISATNELDISAQPTGTYIMRIMLDKNNISAWKIIKE